MTRMMLCCSGLNKSIRDHRRSMNSPFMSAPRNDIVKTFVTPLATLVRISFDVSCHLMLRHLVLVKEALATLVTYERFFTFRSVHSNLVSSKLELGRECQLALVALEFLRMFSLHVTRQCSSANHFQQTDLTPDGFMLVVIVVVELFTILVIFATSRTDVRCIRVSHLAFRVMVIVLLS